MAIVTRLYTHRICTDISCIENATKFRLYRPSDKPSTGISCLVSIAKPLGTLGNHPRHPTLHSTPQNIDWYIPQTDLHAIIDLLVIANRIIWKY